MHLADVGVESAKPLSELLIIIHVINQRIGSIEYSIRGVTVGEMFKERAQLRSRRI